MGCASPRGARRLVLPDFRSRRALQCRQVAGLIFGPIHRRFENEGFAIQPRVAQQSPKGCRAQLPFPDVFVPVQVATTIGLGIVGVEDGHVLQADDGIQFRDRLLVAFGADQVIARHPGVASVNAGTHRYPRQPLQYRRHRTKIAAQMISAARGVLNQEPERSPFEALRSVQQAFAAALQRAAAGVEHQVFGADGGSTLQLTTKGGEGAFMKIRVAAGHIDQVISVDH